MIGLFFIGKRTLFDILRTGVFWVAVGLTAILCFVFLYYGWHDVKAELDREKDSAQRHRAAVHDPSDPDDQPFDESWNPIEKMKPETLIIWPVHGIIVGFGNLLAIFVMMGLLGREIDRRSIDLLIARPVTRGQIYFGKLFAGWAAVVVYTLLILGWSFACQAVVGMDLQPGLATACAISLISPLLFGAITLVLTIWMRGYLAGLISMVAIFSSGTMGILFIKLLGVTVLKLKWAVWVIFKILPPINVIGQTAIEHLEKDAWLNLTKMMFDQFSAGPADGLYSMMWHVYVYMGVVILIGWLSFFRRQFN